MELSSSEKMKKDDVMLIRFQQLNIDIPANIMTYTAIERFNEFDPQVVADFCQFRNPGHQLHFPLMQEENGIAALNAIRIDDNTRFAENSFGIFEPINGERIDPSEIELMIVPLLCFDQKGNRVGYGKGYYDRFLTSCSKNCLKIGFSYFEAEETIDDIAPHDIPLDFCITPEMIYQFQ